MIDHEKKKNGAGALLAAGILAAAIAGAMIPAGMTGGAPSATENTEQAESYFGLTGDEATSDSTDTYEEEDEGNIVA